MQPNFLVSALLLSFPCPALAGEAVARLTCVSDSGKTELYAGVWGIYSGLQAIRFRGHAHEWRVTGTSDDDQAVVVKDQEVGVYTLSYFDKVGGGRYHLWLWAIPSTFEVVDSDGRDGREHYRFRAKLKARDPRPSAHWAYKAVVNCEFRYAE